MLSGPAHSANGTVLRQQLRAVALKSHKHLDCVTVHEEDMGPISLIAPRDNVTEGVCHRAGSACITQKVRGRRMMIISWLRC